MEHGFNTENISLFTFSSVFLPCSIRGFVLANHFLSITLMLGGPDTLVWQPDKSVWPTPEDTMRNFLLSVFSVASWWMLFSVGLVGCSAGKPEPESLGKAVNDAYKENDRLTSENDRLKSQVVELKRSQAVLAEEKEQLRSKVDSSTRKIEEAERRTKMATDRNGELLKQAENLAKENKQLAKEIQDLRETLKS